MSKMIQLRNVPDPLHRTLKSRAAIEGVSLTDYILRYMRELAAAPTNQELTARLAAREPVELRVSPAALIRHDRDSR